MYYPAASDEVSTGHSGIPAGFPLAKLLQIDNKVATKVFKAKIR